MFGWFCEWFDSLVFWFGLVSLLTFLVPFLVTAYVLKEQNLKEKYPGTEWALVTGGSSGIGRALTEKLAEQKINVVVAALDDDILKKMMTETTKKFPDVKFRAVGVNLAAPGYMQKIIDCCADGKIQPNLIFNNAGFVATGLFADSPLGRQMANYDCNATASVKITHHFLNQMLDSKQKGCVCFTSSPAGLMPTPTTVMYGATKAFLTSFGSSLAGEVHSAGIDVLVVHPSPVDTGFYAGNKHDLGAMKMFQKTATPPTNIADCFFRSVGRVVIHEQGYFSLCFKMLLKFIEPDFLAIIIAKTTAMNGDFKKVVAHRPLAKKSN
jgi:short-subunit dehydrogenase